MSNRKIILILLICTPLYAIDIGKFSLPVPEKYRNYISSGQGLRDTIDYESWKGKVSTEPYHYAIDFAVPEGTEVYASKDGIAREVYPSYLNWTKDIHWKGHPTFGGLIIIEHFDGTVSLYAHLSRTDVCEGDEVERGQQIGLSGGNPRKPCSGISTNAHLHWACMINIADFIEEHK